MNRMLFVLIPLILLLAACSPTLAEARVTATPTAAATSTPTFTPTLTATPTASPTPTFTPTPTPITLPVTNGTPIPDLPYEVITAENVSRLRQIARYGYPRLLQGQPYRLTAGGKTIAVGTTAGVEFYDAQSQAKTGALAVDFLSDFDLTPDGKYLLTSAGETLTVWTRDGQKVREFALEAGDAWALNAVALSPDGALLAVQRKKADWQEQDKVDVYRVSDGSLLDTVRGMGAVFSPDGQYLASVFDGAVRLYPVAELGEGWEKRLPKQTLPWCGINEKCWLTFSPDGTLAAVVHPSRVDVFRVADRKLVRQVSGWKPARYEIPNVTFSGNTKYLFVVTVNPDFGFKAGVLERYQKAIVVDISNGEWVIELNATDEFSYLGLDVNQVENFRWRASGEIPYLAYPEIRIENKKIILEGLVNADSRNSFVACVYQECGDPFVGSFVQEGKSFSLIYSETDRRWKIVKDETGENLISFTAPEDAYITFHVFPTSIGDVVVTIVGQGLSFSVTAYRPDGKKANIANHFVPKMFFDGQKIAFIAYDEGVKILDIEQWSVKQFGTDEDLVCLADNKIYIAKQSWDQVPRSIQEIDLSTRQSQYINVPDWRLGSNGWATGFEVAESGEKIGNLFLVSTGGVLYIIDLNQKETIGAIKTIAPYSNLLMKFSSDGRFLATYGNDGFIRVWAVVAEDAPVR